MMNFKDIAKLRYRVIPFTNKAIRKDRIDYSYKMWQVIFTVCNKNSRQITVENSDKKQEAHRKFNLQYVLIVALFLISTNIFSQTYRLVNIFSDRVPDTYLSHWDPVERNAASPDTFSLWGYQLYYDDDVNGIYEVEYYKGSAKEMYKFLTNAINFTEKYRNEDQVMTFISGVKVKTCKILSFRYTLIYDRENKVIRKFNERQLKEMLIRFVSRCNNLNIKYK